MNPKLFLINIVVLKIPKLGSQFLFFSSSNQHLETYFSLQISPIFSEVYIEEYLTFPNIFFKYHNYRLCLVKELLKYNFQRKNAIVITIYFYSRLHVIITNKTLISGRCMSNLANDLEQKLFQKTISYITPHLQINLSTLIQK